MVWVVVGVWVGVVVVVGVVVEDVTLDPRQDNSLSIEEVFHAGIVRANHSIQIMDERGLVFLFKGDDRSWSKTKIACAFVLGIVDAIQGYSVSSCRVLVGGKWESGRTALFCVRVKLQTRERGFSCWCYVPKVMCRKRGRARPWCRGLGLCCDSVCRGGCGGGGCPGRGRAWAPASFPKPVPVRGGSRGRCRVERCVTCKRRHGDNSKCDCDRELLREIVRGRKIAFFGRSEA